MVKFFFAFALLIVCVTGFSQQQASIDHYLPLLHHTNGDLLYNTTAVNPCLTDDSVAYRVRSLLQEQWIGFSESPTEINFSGNGHIPNTGHRVGMELEWWGNSQIRNRLVRLNYSYRFDIHIDQSLKVGANLDIASLKVNEIHGLVLAEPSDKFFTPNLNLGVCYTYKRKSLAIAYGGLLKNRLEGTRIDYQVSENRLLLNYISWMNIGPLFRFSSDLMLSTNFEVLNYFALTKFTYRNMITGGAFYNSTNKSKGLMFSGLFQDRFEIGYQFFFDVIRDQLLGGHSLFIGYKMTK